MYRRLSKIPVLITFSFALLFVACASSPASREAPSVGAKKDASASNRMVEPLKNSKRVVHVLVALCDNVHQGIVPVSASLGNGNDPSANLYWGAAYGLKTYFGKSKSWELISDEQAPKSGVLERLVYKHSSGTVLMVADAYRGDRLRAAIVDTLASLSGSLRKNINIGDETVQIYGGADVVAFVGHNGLMDFKLGKEFPSADARHRKAIVLACASRPYFRKALRNTGSEPMLWTSHLMAPEAYTLHDALESWIAGDDDETVRRKAAAAYSKYQQISLKAAEALFVTGWE